MCLLMPLLIRPGLSVIDHCPKKPRHRCWLGKAKRAQQLMWASWARCALPNLPGSNPPIEQSRLISAGSIKKGYWLFPHPLRCQSMGGLRFYRSCETFAGRRFPIFIGRINNSTRFISVSRYAIVPARPAPPSARAPASIRRRRIWRLRSRSGTGGWCPGFCSTRVRVSSPG